MFKEENSASRFLGRMKPESGFIYKLNYILTKYMSLLYTSGKRKGSLLQVQKKKLQMTAVSERRGRKVLLKITVEIRDNVREE